MSLVFFFQAEDGIRYLVRSRGLGDVYKRQVLALLVDDRVDGDRGLAGLPVADDQLALAAADRHLSLIHI